MKKTFFAIVFVFAISFFATAADKVGYLNMETIFSNYYKTACENLKFEQKRQDFEEQMNVLKNEFENSYKEFEKVAKDSENELLSETVRKDSVRKAQLLEERLHQKDQEMQRTYQEGMRELQKNKAEMEDKIIDELLTLTRKYAAEKKYTHVYEISGKTLNRMPVLIVYPEEQEFTDDFLKYANQGHEKEKEDAQATLKQLRKE